MKITTKEAREKICSAWNDHFTKTNIKSRLKLALFIKNLGTSLYKRFLIEVKQIKCKN